MLIIFLMIAQEVSLSVFTGQISMTSYRSSIVFAQSQTGTDANTTTKTSGTRDGTSKKSTSIFPGFIKGIITDESTNGQIAGASVAIKQSTKTVASFDTTSNGAYFFEVLPGNYSIVVNKSPFKENKVSASISAFKTSTKNIEMSTLSGGDVGGKSFTFNCEQSMKRGFFFGLETLTLNVGDTENCTLELTNHESGKTVEIATNVSGWFGSSIKIEPSSGVTDANGALAITITAIRNGRDWAAWAVPNDDGQFMFNKKTYDTGLAWGMFVEVR